jgi:hypothetical protein
MRIAVDFDGTIVEHRYPKIGKTMEGAFEVLHALSQAGHQLILWTFRSGEYLDEAVSFCDERGITFFAVNENFPGETQAGDFSRLIEADVYIDDRNVGGFIGWQKVAEIMGV